MKLISKNLLFLLLCTGIFAQAVNDFGVNTYSFRTPINDKWQYNASANVYYIVGIMYCATPADNTYEQMGIFVPGAYMNAIDNGNGTYTCTINQTAIVNGYTASQAPIVVPVNTPGYAAQAAPTAYSSTVATFTNAGFIYLWPGMRGKNHGAPLGVVDLKAAVRYFRYLKAVQNAVPGKTECIFSFGMSGGGAQSAIFGASGNSILYKPYLSAIGADSVFTDNIAGSMCWCPITNLDLGDAAHEWNMGQTRTSLTTPASGISKGLAAEFASYINAIGLKNPVSGQALSLTSTTNGYFQNGSYYKYVMDVINDAITRYNSFNGTGVAQYTATDTAALFTFSNTYKKATKGLGAYDNYTAKSAIENTVFGIAGTAAHFDKYLGAMVNTYDPGYYSSFVSDLASTNVDAVGKNVQTRLMMYTPMYYLINNDTYYNGGGTGTSNVAPYWRIRTGINQSDAPLCTEINLALALSRNTEVRNVDFATIWAKAHVQAEDTGSANNNFIIWVNKCATEIATGIGQGNAVAPSQFQLAQNYPNPFNPSSRISFSLPEGAHAVLTVYNQLGQKIEELSNGYFSEGSHSITWDASHYSSGVYLYELKTEKYRACKKLLLLR